MQNNLQ